MARISIKKLISVVLFIIIIVLLIVAYMDLEFVKTNNLSILVYGIIIISVIFLFILNFRNSNNFTENSINASTDINQKKKKRVSGRSIENQIKLHAEGITSNLENIKDLKIFSEKLLKNFSNEFSIVQGIVYTKNNQSGKFSVSSSYAVFNESEIPDFDLGDGIPGQVAENKEIKLITDIAEGYITVLSGLGSSSPKNLLVIPFVFKNKTIAVAELAAFNDFPEFYSKIYKRINTLISEKINTLIK